MDFLLVAGLTMILLHRADGGEVAVAPAHVTGLHSKAPMPNTNKLSHPEGRCVLWLADGRLLSVIETCDVVKKLLGEADDRTR